jgi:hypothetical protein
MTNPEQQINPPLELVEQLQDLGNLDAIQLAYQAGADQELEACCEWFQEFYKTESWSKRDLTTFRSARRPKPRSLKERALSETAAAIAGGNITPERGAIIRLALESIPNVR